jgi:H/ACA ribonucleoprotein complex subunit 2
MGKNHRRVVPLLPIASPVAGHRLTKRIGGLIAKCADERTLVKGVKDTTKLLRNREQGICVMGGNVSPMDIITHLPAVCEVSSVPYVFVPTKEQISAYAERTTPIACVLIRQPDGEEWHDEYDAVVAEIQALAQNGAE